MDTVDEAISAGKKYLLVGCGPCRVIREVRWERMPGLLGSDRLVDVARRLVCSECGTRPAPEEVRMGRH